MKELIFTKPSPVGEVRVILRIVRHILYFKYNQSPYMDQAIKSFEAKGVKFRKSAGWLEVDIFNNVTVAKLRDYEVDLEEDSDEAIEEKLGDFYLAQYIKSGFKLE